VTCHERVEKSILYAEGKEDTKGRLKDEGPGLTPKMERLVQIV